MFSKYTFGFDLFYLFERKREKRKVGICDVQFCPFCRGLKLKKSINPSLFSPFLSKVNFKSLYTQENTFSFL